MAIGILGRIFGYGAVGGAAYSAGYVHKQSDAIGDVADGLSAVSKEAAEGFGALLAAARTGFSSSQNACRPPPPMVTHVYHDRDSGKSSIVTVLVVGGVGLTGYYAVCWWKGWDFFGLSQQRTQQMFQSLNDKFVKYTTHAKEELTRLRRGLDASATEQARQADVLEAVNSAVRDSGAALESLDLRSSDIAEELRRSAVTNEAVARSIMSVQFFLAAVAEGSITDREQALAMLQQSFQQSAATLPSVQKQGRIAGVEQGTAWGFSKAVEAGRQIVSAPVAAIASYFWPAYRQPGVADQNAQNGHLVGDNAQASGAGRVAVFEIEEEGAGAMRSYVNPLAAHGDTSSNGPAVPRGEEVAGGLLGVRGWVVQAADGQEEISEAVGSRPAFSGGGVVRSSIRMPANVAGGPAAPQHGSPQRGGAIGAGGRARFDSASDGFGEGRRPDAGVGSEVAEGPPVRIKRPIFFN